MAVLVSRSCFSLFVVFLLFASYPSAVRSKPTTDSSILHKENVDYDLETTKSKTGQFFHEFDQDITKKLNVDELKPTTRPVPTKPDEDRGEGTSEKVKISKTSEELDSKSAGEKKLAGKKEKTMFTDMDYPVEYDSSESGESGVSSDVVTKKSSKKSTENQDKSAEESGKPAKENEIKKNKTRKTTTEEPEPEEAERLPSAQRQKSVTTTDSPTAPLPNTTPASVPNTGAATSASWPRALVSFAVTVSTVYLLL